MDEPVILKSIDEQIEEEERARGGTIKVNGGTAQAGKTNEDGFSINQSINLEGKSGAIKYNEAEEEKVSPNFPTYPDTRYT